MSFSWSFRFSWADTADNKPEIKTTLDSGQEWFCEKHFVPKGTAPDGMQQFCAFCQSDASLFAANPDGDSDITAVYCGDAVQNPSLIPCPTFAGENGLVIYGLPDFYVSPTVGLTTVMLCFRYKAPWQPKDLYDGASLTFYYGTNVANMGGWQGLNKYQFASSPNWAAADPVDLPEDASFCTVTTSSVSDFNSKYIAYWASVHSFGSNMNTTFSSSSDGRYLWLRLNIENDVQANIAQLYFTKPYTDPSGQTTLKPGDPGFDTIGGIFEMIKKILDSIVNLPSKIAEAVKGFFDMVVNAIVKLGQTILDGLKSLFIPSEGYFEGKANEMRAWLEQHLGLLVYPFTLVADLADRVAGLSNGEPVVHVPEIAYIQDNVKYVLIAEQDVNIYDQVNRKQIFLDIHKYYLMAMDAAIAMALVVLAWMKFDQITGGRDT